MKRVAIGLVALMLSASAALAAPPTAEQEAAFKAQCLKNSGGNTTLCECKATQAMKLIDSDFMDVVIGSMKGKSLTHEQNVPYGIYISKSNAVCAPGM